MTIKMTSKHQITIPKEITKALGLGIGSLFAVKVIKNRIELIPLELSEKVFTEKDCKTRKRQRDKGNKKIHRRFKKGKNIKICHYFFIRAHRLWEA